MDWRLPHLWDGWGHRYGGFSGGRVCGAWIWLRSGGKCSRGFRINFYCFGRLCNAGANRRGAYCSGCERFMQLPGTDAGGVGVLYRAATA